MERYDITHDTGLRVVVDWINPTSRGIEAWVEIRWQGNVPSPKLLAFGRYDLMGARTASSLALPIDWSITYERGDDQRGTWTREEQLARRWLVLEPDPGRKVVAVRLDPERRIYIDTDMSNNQWFDDSDRLAPLRWSERAFTQVSQYLHWMSKIGG